MYPIALQFKTPISNSFFQMIGYLYKRIVASGWAPNDPDPADCMGVLVRKQRGTYITMPTPINDSLLDAAVKLNIIAALTMRPEMLDGILASLIPGQSELRFQDGSQLQILDSIMQVDHTNVKKFQYACICRQERLILVWHDDLTNLIPQAAKVEERLLSMVSCLLACFVVQRSNNRSSRFGATEAWLQTSFRHLRGLDPRCRQHSVRLLVTLRLPTKRRSP